MKRSRCATCGAAMIWARTEANGRPIPLDPEPVAGGNLEITATRGGVPIVRVVSGTLFESVECDRYVSHFATCSTAHLHRRAR